MAQDFAQQVAHRIAELRQAQGLSIRELSRRSDLSPESVSRSERAITEITLTNLAKLCAGLGVDLPSFFAFAKTAAKLGAASPSTSPEVRKAAALLVHLAPARRKRVVRALELLLRADGK